MDKIDLDSKDLKEENTFRCFATFIQMFILLTVLIQLKMVF